METKAQIRKSELRKRLVAAAERQIANNGLRSVKARDLAEEAGCALGAIYNVFDDIGSLVMEVNGRTFQKLGDVVAASLERADSVGANDRLILMSHAYLRFAAEHTHLWRALFELEMSADGPVPDWYLAALRGLFRNIAKPLSEIFPDMGSEELDLMTRALFSSVHGIVLLGLEKRISGVPVANIEKMISQVLFQIGNK